MRLTLASLLAGGCLLATTSLATADEIRLDDNALDIVAAGLPTIQERRHALLGVAALQLALVVTEKYAEDPQANAPALPIIAGLGAFGVEQLTLAGPDGRAWWGFPF